MPKLLTQAVPGSLASVPGENDEKPQSASSAKDEILGICARATARTLKEDLARIAALVKEM